LIFFPKEKLNNFSVSLYFFSKLAPTKTESYVILV
jgi:hypothetical protein